MVILIQYHGEIDFLFLLIFKSVFPKVKPEKLKKYRKVYYLHFLLPTLGLMNSSIISQNNDKIATWTNFTNGIRDSIMYSIK